MMLVRSDDDPILRIAEPIAHAGSDGHFHARSPFNGHAPAVGEHGLFAVAREDAVWPQDRAEPRLVVANEDAREGSTAFAEKRMPEWKAR